ncbi:hypothetical protein BV134_1318 [Haemophilus influenzae]|nr:hypothetical protein BV131_1317 [Haemophilus influenzae]AVJ05348.1 hypothetical protein BV134_1318 [Haemophilus influenzae]
MKLYARYTNPYLNNNLNLKCGKKSPHFFFYIIEIKAEKE